MSAVVVALAGRTLRKSLRRPQLLAPLVIFPTLLLAVNTGGLSRATSLPGFPPVQSFFAFQIPAAMTQSLLLGGVAAGIGAALEMELGFFDRLAASPIPRSAIVLGRLLAGAGIACLQVAWFLALGFAFGVHVEGGPLGVLLVFLIGAVAGTGFAAIGVTLAVSAGNASIVQGIFPLVFVVLFLSSAFFPRNLMTSPANEIARFNPLSYIANGLRDPIVSSVSAGPVLEGLAAAAGIALLFGALSVRTLLGKLRDA